MSAIEPYTPRAGSRAEAAIEALQRAGWLSVGELADEIEVDRNTIHAVLGVPIKHGAIVVRAHDGKAGFALPGDGDPPPADREKSAREKPPPFKNRPRANCHVVGATAPAIDPPGSVAVADDGSILLIDGDRITARLSAQQARNIAAMAARFK